MPTDPAAFDRLVVDTLRDVHNFGADLYNTSRDYAGTYRLYHGALLTVRPLLSHRPTAQQRIDQGLQEVEREPTVAHKAFRLHVVIEDVRRELKKTAAAPQPPEKKPQDKPPPPQPPEKKPDNSTPPQTTEKKPQSSAAPPPGEKITPSAAGEPTAALTRGPTAATGPEVKRLHPAFLSSFLPLRRNPLCSPSQGPIGWHRGGTAGPGFSLTQSGTLGFPPFLASRLGTGAVDFPGVQSSGANGMTRRNLRPRLPERAAA